MAKLEEIKIRAIKHGRLFIKRDATVRTVAKESGFSKSTVHLDLHRLEFIHFDLYKKCMKKLNYHKSVRSIRGGEASRKKHERKRNNDNK